MGIFGEGTPALWENGKDQVSTATNISVVFTGISTLTTLNAHDYELGIDRKSVV